MRGLAAGEEGYEKYRKIFQEKFVFLNEYTTSVQAEHEPRGPEGPYRFHDRSVPVLVLKRWDGRTLVQQLGFVSDPAQGRRQLAAWVDKALKENGPVLPPKQLRPLLKSMEKARGHLEKGLVAAAVRELETVVKAGADGKRFPETPEVAVEAAELLKRLGEYARRAIEEAAGRAAADPEEARRELKRIVREYGRLEGIEEAVAKALEALPG